jgi:hypothetical protein
MVENILLKVGLKSKFALSGLRIKAVNIRREDNIYSIHSARFNQMFNRTVVSTRLAATIEQSNGASLDINGALTSHVKR